MALVLQRKHLTQFKDFGGSELKGRMRQFFSLHEVYICPSILSVALKKLFADREDFETNYQELSSYASIFKLLKDL